MLPPAEMTRKSSLKCSNSEKPFSPANHFYLQHPQAGFVAGMQVGLSVAGLSHFGAGILHAGLSLILQHFSFGLAHLLISLQHFDLSGGQAGVTPFAQASAGFLYSQGLHGRFSILTHFLSPATGGFSQGLQQPCFWTFLSQLFTLSGSQPITNTALAAAIIATAIAVSNNFISILL
ncbi:MAG TPA: hypothetical protein PKK48_08290 [Phycisphaerae bacterium]|nr:hypothetical protein [Phycisphaerae bacterium]